MRLIRTVLAVCLLCGTAVAAPKKFAAVKPARAAAAGSVSKESSNPYRLSPYVGAVSADAATGHILFQDKADAIAYPASVTKLMTAFLVLEDVKAGRYALGDKATATTETYYSEASWVGIKVGESMTIDDLLMALLVHSANDAAIVLGVHSAGSLEAFVNRMNECARELGMTNTRYFNPNGLPPGGPPNSKTRYPWKSFNRTTAADQLKLAIAIVRKHPEILRYTSTKVAKGIIGGNGEPLRDFVNHNNVMVKDKMKVINPDGTEAVDGLKTGYIDVGGSSVVLTGKRGGKRAIVVVLGSSSANERDENAARIMEDALSSLSW